MNPRGHFMGVYVRELGGFLRPVGLWAPVGEWSWALEHLWQRQRTRPGAQGQRILRGRR